MPTPLTTDFSINESRLHRMATAKKMEQLLSFAQEKKKLVKTASTVQPQDLITLFAAMLQALNLNTTSDMGNVVESLMKSTSGLEKKAKLKETSISKQDEIKIASKKVRDSHYDIDLSKDIISQGNQKMIMVSCYVKEAYLGRYVIKRNYFYDLDREASADATYDEIMTKMGSLKDRYYNGIIDPPAITTQAKIILDGVISEIAMSEDSLGTTVQR